jgi:hypothetical protein
MDAAYSSKTLITIYQTTRRHIQEGCNAFAVVRAINLRSVFYFPASGFYPKIQDEPRRSGKNVKTENLTVEESIVKLGRGRLLILQAENLLTNKPENTNRQTAKFPLTRKRISILN